MSFYKDTLNLPDTGFPMRGELVKREPEMLQRWYQVDLYGAIRQAKRQKIFRITRWPSLRQR